MIKDKVIRECSECKESFWIFKSENKPYEKFKCANCKFLGVMGK